MLVDSPPGSPTPWRKVLYERQPYPDNYVGASFLEDLRKNVNVTLYSRQAAVLAAGPVLQQLSSVVLVALAFTWLDEGMLQPEPLLATIAVTTTLGYLWLLLDSTNLSSGGWQQQLTADLRLAAVFLVFGYGLSPLLATLTDSVSTDSVYALAASAMALHLATHDYGARAACVSAAVSLNAGLFGALCLASRLPSTLHVFAFLTLAAQLLALLPPVRAHVRRRCGRLALLAAAVTQAGAALLLLGRLSGTAAALLTAGYLLVCPLLPLLYVRLQKYKDNIYGPWDEAIVEDTRRTIRRDDLLRED
ncbi:phosphatidylinositol N-acetylglucosaminyltransferase subunit C-like [Amphibalanus amphitrite]|uniref:phosphatidylinositol N-acetylglucosaminyltransferase subunit C-like n=1 Tax=Amphibalanus amphitrite TaxID=1232801 RepID=UPI001C906D11|nr:phosphatidylinositol N-acetylglucosaminyltransferase subunit C-like [Amphibalanus amphitrite]XP_043235697.1 phosphatidylinositol N-acetylglucosaminyltransferase subunit C-like [Amphibalanus amphitrite]